MQIRLVLKKAYEWPSKHYGIPNKGQIGFVQTNLNIELGMRVTFEELNAHSYVGDINTDHYKYYSGKTYECVDSHKRLIGLELVEV